MPVSATAYFCGRARRVRSSVSCSGASAAFPTGKTTEFDASSCFPQFLQNIFHILLSRSMSVINVPFSVVLSVVGNWNPPPTASYAAQNVSI